MEGTSRERHIPLKADDRLLRTNRQRGELARIPSLVLAGIKWQADFDALRTIHEQLVFRTESSLRRIILNTLARTTSRQVSNRGPLKQWSEPIRISRPTRSVEKSMDERYPPSLLLLHISSLTKRARLVFVGISGGGTSPFSQTSGVGRPSSITRFSEDVPGHFAQASLAIETKHENRSYTSWHE